MKCRIRTFAMIREAIGEKIVELEIDNSTTISQIVMLITTKYPKTKEYLLNEMTVSPNITIALNGENINYEKYNSTTIEDRDTIAIIPPAGGG